MNVCDSVICCDVSIAVQYINKKRSILKHTKKRVISLIKNLHWKKLQIDTQTETFPYIVYTFILWQKIMIQCAI